MNLHMADDEEGGGGKAGIRIRGKEKGGKESSVPTVPQLTHRPAGQVSAPPPSGCRSRSTSSAPPRRRATPSVRRSISPPCSPSASSTPIPPEPPPPSSRMPTVVKSRVRPWNYGASACVCRGGGGARNGAKPTAPAPLSTQPPPRPILRSDGPTVDPPPRRLGQCPSPSLRPPQPFNLVGSPFFFPSAGLPTPTPRTPSPSSSGCSDGPHRTFFTRPRVSDLSIPI